MELLILNIFVSCIVSFTISDWYLKQMTKRTHQWMDEFFEKYRKEYQKFFNELKTK